MSRILNGKTANGENAHQVFKMRNKFFLFASCEIFFYTLLFWACLCGNLHASHSGFLFLHVFSFCYFYKSQEGNNRLNIDSAAYQISTTSCDICGKQLYLDCTSRLHNKCCHYYFYVTPAWVRMAQQLWQLECVFSFSIGNQFWFH